MVSEKLDAWDVVNEQVERSKIRRFPYKQVFGVSLTAKITELRLLGVSKEAVFDLLSKELKPFLSVDGEKTVIPKLWISVCARFGEQKSYNKTLNSKR